MTQAQNVAVESSQINSSGVLQPAGGGTGVTTTTGSGNAVLSTSPTLSGTAVIPTINSGAATALTLQSAGTTAITVDTSQNVGIGTSSPTAKLNVSGTIHITGAGSFPSTGVGIELVSSSVGGTNYIQAYNRTGSTWQNLEIDSAQTVFGTGGTERMRITSAGYVGIGTSAPTVKLNVSRDGNVYAALDTYETQQVSDGSICYTRWIQGASSIATICGVDTATGIFGTTSNHALAIRTNNTERMRITSAGYVGIGTTSANAPLAFGASAGTAGTANKIRLYDDNGTVVYGIGISSGQQNYVVAGGGSHVFYIGDLGSAAEKMRIDSSGNLLVGGTTQRNAAKITNEFTTGNNGMSFYCVANVNAVDFAIFNANAGTQCGAISRVGTTSAVVYTTTSDYRLKENVKPFVDALDSVSKLKPVTYTWIDGGASANGFIAHELQEICPDAVVGKKDEMNEDGSPKYQAIDQSKVVALLTAAVQELSAKVTALETQLGK